MHVITSITDGLRAIYFQKVKPLEDLYKFHAFFGESLKDGDFDAKPLVLLLGAYSTGKTTFIEHLLGRQYPGCHIGPEPTTDRFVVVMSGEQDRTTPGNTLAVQPDKLFQGLQSFGTGFLGRLMGSQCRSKLLEASAVAAAPAATPLRVGSAGMDGPCLAQRGSLAGGDHRGHAGRAEREEAD